MGTKGIWALICGFALSACSPARGDGGAGAAGATTTQGGTASTNAGDAGTSDDTAGSVGSGNPEGGAGREGGAGGETNTAGETAPGGGADTAGGGNVSGGSNGGAAGGATGGGGAGGNASGSTQGDWLWATGVGKPWGGTGKVTSVAALANGSTYAVGYFSGSFKLGDLELTSAGSTDVFIIKYDAGGDVLWVKTAGGKGDDQATAATTLADGSLFITGSSSAKASFDGAAPAPHGFDDAFVAKYDASGTLVWVVRSGSTAYEEPTSIAVEADGSCYVGGYFFRGAAKFGGTTLQAVADSEAHNPFIAKYNADGSVAWAVNAGATVGTVKAVAAHSDGSVYATGTFAGTGTWGQTSLDALGVADQFTAKFDASGKAQWAAREGLANDGPSDESGNAICVLADGSAYVAGRLWNDYLLVKYSTLGVPLWKVENKFEYVVPTALAALADGTLFVGGGFQGIANFGKLQIRSSQNNYTFDGFVATYDANGVPLSALDIPLADDEPITGLALLSDGTAYLSGEFVGYGTFGEQAVRANFFDTYVAKLSAAGEWLWARNAGFISDSGAGLEAISARPDGTSYVVGELSGVVDLGSTRLTSAGAADAFLSKLDATGSPLWTTAFGGEGSETAAALAVLPDGSVYVAGTFNYPIKLAKQTLNPLGPQDVYLAKYSPEGALLWVGQVSGRDYESVVSLAALSDGSVLLLGAVRQDVTVVDQLVPAKSNNTDLLLTKLDESGKVLWATREGTGSSVTGPTALAVLPDGSAYVTGQFYGPTVFGAGNLAQFAGFLARYDSLGKLDTAAQMVGMDSASTVSPTSVAVLPDGTAYVTGGFSGTVDLDDSKPPSHLVSSHSDTFVARYDGDVALWATQSNGVASGMAVATLPDGSALVACNYAGRNIALPATFFDTTFIPVGLGQNIILAKLSSEGKFLGFTLTGDGLYQDSRIGLSVLPDSSALVCGPRGGSMMFGSMRLVADAASGASFVAKAASF